MKTHGFFLSLLLAAVMVVMGCGQGEPTRKAAAPSEPVTESTGQAVVDSIKAPWDKSRAVEGTLEKAAEKTADQVKDATP